MTFPRKQIIDHLKKTFRVDVFEKKTKPWKGNKYNLIKNISIVLSLRIHWGMDMKQRSFLKLGMLDAFLSDI